jgi:hypothetical protein
MAARLQSMKRGRAKSVQAIAAAAATAEDAVVAAVVDAVATAVVAVVAAAAATRPVDTQIEERWMGSAEVASCPSPLQSSSCSETIARNK